MDVRPATADADIARCLAIREAVFIHEQSVPRELELDGRDVECRHYLATLGDQPVGAARVLQQGDRAKIQRVAVLSAARGRGVGAALMRRILDDLAAEPGMAEAWLESQTHALAFYEALGFVAEGEEFLDAGIPHQAMRKRLRDA
ncbi:GNAT family N-acetyltransferase [Limibaculum sp. FT325]|uniref:GNAT family N-acetyltransferase n=1 Tax=Thermohalobaculum sediminis TaxID=2939436 RepID=UPI0020BE448D|nr:GNAT family N-acetyltransferase [Limibaculum sediminis]MCL5776622.1 GNAT family N-acetyltransferase [Limibaculum sediminis]